MRDQLLCPGCRLIRDYFQGTWCCYQRELFFPSGSSKSVQMPCLLFSLVYLSQGWSALNSRNSYEKDFFLYKMYSMSFTQQKKTLEAFQAVDHEDLTLEALADSGMFPPQSFSRFSERGSVLLVLEDFRMTGSQTSRSYCLLYIHWQNDIIKKSKIVEYKCWYFLSAQIVKESS